MSGVYGGEQRLIKDMCTSPVRFVNLNFVINNAVSNIPRNEKFFTILQRVFNFFGSSLNRWQELQIEGDQDSLTLKKICSTRWNSRIDTVRDRYTHILKVLTRISFIYEKTHKRNTAVKLRNDLDSFEFVVFIVLWERMLRVFNSSSKELQSPRMDLSGACRLLNCTKKRTTVHKRKLGRNCRNRHCNFSFLEYQSHVFLSK